MRIAVLTEPVLHLRIDLTPSREGQSMRWKISQRGHDPRHIDLLAALALVVLIVAAYRFFAGTTDKPSNTAFIVPSQSVRW